jgi:hypothetical protein
VHPIEFLAFFTDLKIYVNEREFEAFSLFSKRDRERERERERIDFYAERE